MKQYHFKRITKKWLALTLAAAMGIATASPAGTIMVQASGIEVRAAAKNNANAQTVADSVVGTLQAVEYSGLASLVSPSRYTSSEKLNKKTEIFKRDGIPFAEITDEMAIAELNVDNLKVMSFEDAYAKVQADLDTLIPLIVQNSVAGTIGDHTDYFTSIITTNKEKLLLGLTYVYRLYDFNIGSVNIKDKMFEDVDYFGKDYDQLQWLIQLGGAGGDALKVANNTSTFTTYFANKMTNTASVTAFLEAEIAKNSGLAADAWFKDSSKAVIIEQSSALLTNANVKLYSRLKADGTYTKYILPLLNVSENSVYVISAPASITFGLVDTYAQPSNKTTAPATYASEVAAFETELAKVAASQSAFTDLWYRIAKADDRAELVGNRMVIDSMRIKKGANVAASTEWSPKLGDEASVGVKEFFAPMGLYAAFVQANAQAEGTGMRFFMSKAISNDGLCTYTHELTHLLLNSVWMDDNTPRQGLDVEFFARGLYETYWSTDPIMNLNMSMDYSGTSNRVYNESPERFKNVEDLQEYTRGMMDVLYTLDYLEAQSILGKTTAQKKKWFNQMTQTADTRTRLNQGNASATHTVDTIVNIDDTLAASLTKVEDLIDNNIVASRYAIEGLKVTGTAASNGYHVVPLFTSNYSVAQNDNGVAGDVSTRRQAYEFLAEYGYFEGMVPYISNKYLTDATNAGKVLSDTFVINKIFNGDYADMKAFKKAMFARRAEKINQLKPITITFNNKTTQVTSVAQLQTLMDDAVAYDLEMVYVTSGGYNNVMQSYNTQVEKLKAAIYTAYLQETDDFTTSIYKDVVTPTPTATPTPKPTAVPTATPTPKPTVAPTVTEAPTPSLTEEPSVTPTETEAPKPSETPEDKKPVTEIFTDVYDDWYKGYVQYVYDNGLMTGIKGTTEFRPNANITKAQVAQVLYNMEGQPVITNKNVFSDLKDVYSGEWYANAVAWAYSTGVVTGDLNAKKFFPNADVTREQLALMMFRYAKFKAYDVNVSSDLAGLKNAENTSDWALDGVKWAVGAGLISGVEKNGVKDLQPQGNASRAQMAAILQRFCEK